MATVAAVWTTPRDEFLSPEAEASVATVTRCDLDADVVDEHTGLSLLVLNLPNPRIRSANDLFYGFSWLTTLITRPREP